MSNFKDSIKDLPEGTTAVTGFEIVVIDYDDEDGPRTQFRINDEQLGNDFVTLARATEYLMAILAANSSGRFSVLIDKLVEGAYLYQAPLEAQISKDNPGS